MNYELSNIWHKVWHAYCDFLANLAAISQSSYNVLAVVYLLLHYRKNIAPISCTAYNLAEG